MRPWDWTSTIVNTGLPRSVLRCPNAVAGRSPYHFIRLFRSATGTTPRQYVIRRRVERARELLVGGSGIAEAAARVGFSSQSHLHRHVRKLLGLTPGELAGGRASSIEHPR